MSLEDDDYRAAQAAGDRWQDALDKTDKGALKPTLKNAYLLLKHGLDCERLFAFNEFTLDIEKLVRPPWDAPAGPWTDFDDLAARLRLGSLHGVDFKTETVSDAALLLAYDAKYHPVRDYLNDLVWDGKARINTWLEHYMGAVTYLDHETQRYLGAVGSMWLIGAVARIFQPGCKMDNVLILEGVQDIGKSTALKTLAQPWFVDTPFTIGDKDAFLMMRGKWICELAELDAFNKAESTKAKAFFSLDTATVRLPYGSRTVDLPRQCVFSGTTNQDEYLRDGTGNRRYWPVLCIKAAIDELARDRNQLWAEAVVQYRAGITWWPHDDMKSAFKAQQQLREISDPWEAVISIWLAQSDIELRGAKEGVTTAEILHDCLKIPPDRMDERAMQMRVAKALRALGFERRQSTDRNARAERRRVYLLRDQPKDPKP